MTPQFQFERQVFDQVRKRGLLLPEDRVLVAVSGGPDSVALLQCLSAWRSRIRGLSLGIVHVHHGIRGEEADRDAEFVECMARQMVVPYFLRPVPVSRLHREQKGQSLQAVAHRERYRAFIDVAEKFGASKVALGHTQDDQAETVVMWMLRGAGMSGLAGMAMHRAPFFIRPFLSVPRLRIIEYLAQKGVPYREDSSNKKLQYLRNRIRQQLIPMMKQFNPNILGVLSRQSDILREENRYLDQVAELAMASVQDEHEPSGLVLRREEFLDLPVPIQRRVVMKAFRAICTPECHPPYEVVEGVLGLMSRASSGMHLQFKGLTVVREYDIVRFTLQKGSSTEEFFHTEVPFPVPGIVIWPNSRQRVQGEFVSLDTCSIQSDRFQAFFDGDLFTHDLVIRSWKPGDSFFPFGFGGKRKKVQDYFTDIKVSRSKRAQVPLLVAPEGILWIGGYRSDHRFRVTKNTTRVLSVHLVADESLG